MHVRLDAALRHSRNSALSSRGRNLSDAVLRKSLSSLISFGEDDKELMDVHWHLRSLEEVALAPTPPLHYG
jgi:hypothetical protein